LAVKPLENRIEGKPRRRREADINNDFGEMCRW